MSRDHDLVLRWLRSQAVTQCPEGSAVKPEPPKEPVDPAFICQPLSNSERRLPRPGAE